MAKTSTSLADQPSQHPQILRQLEKILVSEDFYATRYQKRFLRFVVDEVLAGRGAELKGYTVATQVFGRGPNFNPQLDPIVSVQANKLRKALAHYYLTEGRSDQLHITIPKGTYVPLVSLQQQSRGEARTEDRDKAINGSASWPAVLLRGFANKTGDNGSDLLCQELTAELAAEISFYRNISVIVEEDGQLEKKEQSFFPARFTVNGEVYGQQQGVKILVHLIDNKTGRYLLGDSYKSISSTPGQSDGIDGIVKGMAAKISGDYGVISRLLLAETRKTPIAQLGTYNAILRFYEYEFNHSPETFTGAFEALSAAIKIDPDCSRLWSSLSLQYALISCFLIPGFEKPLEKALLYAQRAVSLDPLCQRALGTLAFVRFCNDELDACIADIDCALALSPDSLLILDGLAYLLILSGAWERGVPLAEKAIKTNPYYRPALHDALWVHYLRENRLDLAYQEAMHGKRHWNFWNPLLKTATFGLMGQVEQAQQHLGQLLLMRPDFPSCGRVLIRKFIKFEEIAERIEKGLITAGAVLQ